MKRYLYESLKKYKRMDFSSFHTPGHKCNFNVLNKLISLDFTELLLTDSLYEATGIIKKAEDSLAKLYSTQKSLFSCGGNTLCIQAMLRLAVPNGGKILCDRTIHRSAVSAMALLGIEPIWVRRKFNKENRLFDMLNLESIKKELASNSDIEAIYITSPSYHGILQDIKSISNECKKYNVPVLVDNAHGSHLMFLEKTLHPLEQGADLVADSAHKTLPVLTGGAWLHVNNQKYVKKAKEAMSLFGSTSPSYPIMASMDICTDWLSTKGKSEFLKLEIRVLNIKKLAKEKGFYVPIKNSDPLRITLGVWNFGITGYEFRNYLYKFKIEPEFCDENYVVLIPSPFNSKQDWKRLKDALINIDKFYEKKEIKDTKVCEFKLPNKVIPLREALMNKSEVIDITKSKGRVAAGIVCPCPPGIPVVMPGEEIGDFEIEALKKYGVLEIAVLK